MQIHVPTDLEDALRFLGSDEGIRCLAGGQSLVPMLNLGLLDTPALLSLRAIPGLDRLELASSGSLSIGAMATQADLAALDAKGRHRVLILAARQMAHPAIRNFGTVGGSLCHADPAADLPPAVVAADASLTVRGPEGVREIPADRFFVDYLTTALSDTEILVGLTVPPAPPGSVGHYYKYARVDGDYATVSVAVTMRISDGACMSARIVLGSCAQTPLRLDEADAALVDAPLVNGTLDPRAVARATSLLQDASEPLDDVRGSSDYRRRLIPGLVARALNRAVADVSHE